MARAAAELESGPEFTRLQRILSDLPGQDAEHVIEGVLPDDVPDALAQALRAIARRTEQVRSGELILGSVVGIRGPCRLAVRRAGSLRSRGASA
jgi:hypothetical protein